jgi:polygalacturonase
MNKIGLYETMNHSLNIRNFGAVGNGLANDTCAIQSALDACRQQGGGTVFVPAGQYVFGPIFFHSHTHLYLDAGAELLGSENMNDYPVINSRWEGQTIQTYASLITGKDLHNITISGRGVINGRGVGWWQHARAKSLLYPRPRLIGLDSCENVLIENVTLTNSPSWTINPVRCQNLSVRGVTIDNPPNSPNTDGINPDSCRFVRISDCHISSGDDCIAIKAGTEHEAPELHQPCRDITISNCTFARGHGGVVIGSETSGSVKNVVIANCVFVGTDRGIRLKSRRGRGGVVEDIRAANLIMDGVAVPVAVNLHYACGRWGDPVVADRNPLPVDDGTPYFRHIYLSQISAREVSVAAGFLHGLAEAPIEDVSLRDVSISLAAEAAPGQVEMADGLEPMQQAGLIVHNVRGLRLDQVEILGQKGEALMLTNSSEVRE